MSLDGAYDPDNVLAKIARGEIPSVKVLEDDRVLAIMDVFPQAEGHVLVLHKTSTARNLLEMDAQSLSEVMTATQAVARAVKAALKPDGILINQFNGAPAGQTIFHLHVHVIPRRDGEPLGRHGGGMADMAELQTLADRIKAHLPR